MKIKWPARIAAGLAPLALIVTFPGVAHAVEPVPGVNAGQCWAHMNIAHNYKQSGHDYAKGEFELNRPTPNSTCVGWLETDRRDGKGFVRVSAYYEFTGSGTYRTTGYHYDGSGWRSRVAICFRYYPNGAPMRQSATVVSKSY